MTSDWKQSGIDRRDFRHTKNGPETPRTKANKKKNTKRWCKGVEGREHVPKIHLSNRWHGINAKCGPRTWTWRKGEWWCAHDEVCANCGKVLQWSLDPERCPVKAELDAAKD